MTTNEEYISEASNASQCKQILDYLRKGMTLTSLEALRLFRCMRLASRICDLRKQGENIQVERVKTDSGKMVAQYRLMQ